MMTQMEPSAMRQDKIVEAMQQLAANDRETFRRVFYWLPIETRTALQPTLDGLYRYDTEGA